MSENDISYEGIDEAELVHGLYHGTRALGMGRLHDAAGLSVEQVRADLEAMKPQRPLSAPQDLPGGHGNREGDVLYLDYYRGRPLKCSIDTGRKLLRGVRLYDRDAGPGACAAVMERLRGKR